ncbi:MAG: dephospho-CoA kinase [bacterium]
MIIGVTGGIGSGKSLFSRELEKLGAYVISADKIARELADKNRVLRYKLKDNFGSEVFGEEGNLKRRKLAQLVFSDSKHLKKLNSIFYPPLLEAIRRCIEKVQNRYKKSMIVVDMAIIFEAGAESMFDYIVTVDAPLDLRIKWLKKDRGWTKKEITDRINSQMKIGKKIKKSNFIIENNGSAKELASKASRFFDLVTRCNNGEN